MITRCMWYVCLFPLEGNYIKFIKFLQVAWKELYRKQMLLVRNKLILTHCACLVIIFAFPLISHTCRALMVYFHCIQFVHFNFFFPLPCFTVYCTYSFKVHDFLTKSHFSLYLDNREATQHTSILRTSMTNQHQVLFIPGVAHRTKE